jgi:hypothetical protein
VRLPRREKPITRAEERPESAFVPVVVEATASASLEIVLANDTIVRVSPGCDRRTLELVLAIVMERAAAIHGDRSRAAGAPPC